MEEVGAHGFVTTRLVLLCLEVGVVLRAKTLLLTATKSIQEIADQLGFVNHSPFGTFFKRHTGCSPKDFRKH
ncbi:MAG: helix-turn-helix domain-containing protein [Paludibacteraceae bacterium]